MFGGVLGVHRVRVIVLGFAVSSAVRDIFSEKQISIAKGEQSPDIKSLSSTSIDTTNIRVKDLCRKVPRSIFPEFNK